MKFFRKGWTITSREEAVDALTDLVAKNAAIEVGLKKLQYLYEETKLTQLRREVSVAKLSTPAS